MEKKNVVFLTVLAIATLLTAVVGTTFAYFTATVTNATEPTATQVTTATDLGVTYSDGTQLQLLNGVPGAKSNTKRISVTNNSNTTSLSYSIKWTNVVNNFVQGEGNTDDLVYTLQKVTLNNGEVATSTPAGGPEAVTNAYVTTTLGAMSGTKAYSCAAVSNIGKATITAAADGCELTVYKVPSAPAQNEADPVLVSGTLAPSAVDYYDLTIYYLETGLEQNTNQSTAGNYTCVEPQSTPATNDQAGCEAAGGQWTGTVAARTVTFTSTLQTVLETVTAPQS